MTPFHGLFYQFHFYLFGLLGIASALAFVTRKSPVAAALWLVSTMFCLAALYIMLDAQFIGAIQILVYAGAIMVVFLFVVMLLNLGQPTDLVDLRGRGPGLVAAAIGLLLVADLYWGVRRQHLPDLPPEAVQSQASGAVINTVAAPLFAADGYLLAFEVTSILLLVAIVGAVVLAKRRT